MAAIGTSWGGNDTGGSGGGAPTSGGGIGLVRPMAPQRTSSYQTKGNTGVSAQRRQRRKFMVYVGSIIATFLFGRSIYYSRIAGYFVPDQEIDPITGKKFTRRRPDRHYSKMDPSQTTVELDAILEGQLTLVDIAVPSTALQGGRLYKDDDERQPGAYDNFGQGFKYKGVVATFCHIDWKLQHQNPSAVPMFRDLQAKSRLCETTSVQVDLYDIVQRSREFDDKLGSKQNRLRKSKSDTGKKKPEVLAVPPTGVVFHETRCGSTLMANLLASYHTDLDEGGGHKLASATGGSNVRVYSESPPPVTALRACDNVGDDNGDGVVDGGGCNPKLHRQLIRDVFYMMGRRPMAHAGGDKTNSGQEYHVFYKIQSIGVMNIDKFTSAFPTTPWVFLYRDTVEVMQSHLGAAKGGLDKRHRPVCARNFGNKHQPLTTLQVIKFKSADSDKPVELNDMDMIDYCAAHLAGLSLSAVQEHARSVEKDKNFAMSRFVNYNQMPSVVWNDILPNHFGLQVSKANIQNMEHTASVYSKGRGPKANQEWEEDSTKKQTTASDRVVKASKFYVGDIYEQMERLSSPKHRRRI